MGTTSIEWTDVTWNPVRGCSVVSPGCESCYAMGVAARFSGEGQPYEGLARFSEKRRLPQWTGKVRFVKEHLADPLRWRRPRRVFVNSMSDLFHEELTNEQIAAVFGVMAAASKHTFQVLTKRPARMREWFDWVEDRARDNGSMPVGVAACLASQFLGRPTPAFMPTLMKDWPTWPLPNVHLGVSVENQSAANERIPRLLQTPAAVRFISAEPLLGLLNVFTWLPRSSAYCPWCRATSRLHHEGCALAGDGPLGLDWVIVGGESGPRARPFDVQWARLLVAQCKSAGTPIFVKQLGAKPFDTSIQVGVDLALGRGSELANGLAEWGVRSMQIVGYAKNGNTLNLKDRAGGDMSEWPEDLRVREFSKEHR